MPLACRDNSRRTFSVLDLGQTDYDDAYRLQKELVEAKRLGKDAVDYLLLVEHAEVYTYGRRSPEVPDSAVGENFRFVERGGEVTYHNPGQLVAYPVISLLGSEKDIHLHLRRLEEVILRTIAAFGIAANRREKATGVWVDGGKRKIASIGVAATSWITYHGSALNVCNDLTGFQKINPCGFSSQVMTSMEKEIRREIEFKLVKERFISEFSQVFEREIHS